MRAQRKLQGKVCVVTGASSGLGRAAAVELARSGCHVALAARRGEDLEETGHLCREAGGGALVVPADVTSEEDVERLVSTTLAELGHIDVWVNNAGVTLFGLFEETPIAEHRRVIETNLFGSMNCARAIIPVFKAQRHGVLINVGSVLSKVGQPFVPSYVISKFAVRGLSEALRAELADHADVHVCTIFPFAIDTPHFQSGANYVGLRAHAMPPLQTPEKVARAIALLAARPRREVHVPHAAVLGLALHWAFPNVTERLLLRALEEFHFDDIPQRPTTGNLYRPVEVAEGDVHGRRKPRIGALGFAAWCARELVRIERDAVVRQLHRWRARLRQGAPGAPREPQWALP